MQPSPKAETSSLLFPSLRFCIDSPTLARIVLLEQRKDYERGPGPGRYEKRCLHPRGGWQAAALGRARSLLRRLGDLPSQGIARRSRPVIRITVERLVRAGHPAFR